MIREVELSDLPTITERLQEDRPVQNLTEWASWADIIAAVVGAAAIGVSIWTYFRSRTRRVLTCEFDPVLSPVEIRAGDALGGDIEIRYRGQPVENLFVVLATIRNEGTQPIRKREVVEPVIFDFGSEAQLVRRPKVVRKHPDNLEATWSFLTEAREKDGKVLLSNAPVRETQAVLGFELLNPREEFTTEFGGIVRSCGLPL